MGRPLDVMEETWQTLDGETSRKSRCRGLIDRDCNAARSRSKVRPRALVWVDGEVGEVVRGVDQGDRDGLEGDESGTLYEGR